MFSKSTSCLGAHCRGYKLLSYSNRGRAVGGPVVKGRIDEVLLLQLEFIYRPLDGKSHKTSVRMSCFALDKVFWPDRKTQQAFELSELL